jgi:hypothetical protein
MAAGTGADTAAALLADPATDPATVTQLAYRAAAEAVGNRLGWHAGSTNWAPADGSSHGAWRHSPATTYLSALVLADPGGPGSLVYVGWVGDTRLYWLPLPGTGDAELLTEDHARAGTMTRWVAPDHRPELNDGSRRPDQPVRISGAGLLVLVTDGLWERLPGADDLATALSVADYGDPAAAADRLLAAGVAMGGQGDISDDTTVVVVQLDTDGRPVGRPAGGAGPAAPAAP